MRWDLLFDDLESQLDREQREEERVLALESERLRLARLSLRERIMALAAADGERGGIRLELAGGRTLLVQPTTFGRDWLSGHLVVQGGRSQCIVPMDAIAAVAAGRRQVDESLTRVPESSTRIAERIGLAFVLRDLGRRRIPVDLESLDGRHHGTIDRVGLDHLDLALHEPGTPRRERDVRGYRLVPFARVVAVTVR
ncbi:hypothetical protein AVP42_00139 [Agromyces sp. NDB4Y10]|uniref:hypothetical protein n=1 Tax=Agromyces sp. NDB4Y10 TaxID=1775951 RepID=UPI0007B2BC45|nr:hypothetical protein [Agromyces sp. NDB4Y10]KZE95579.1 hypothetical protein AVP42_00139 [Agromyces sp. NDB4Y10]